MVQIIPSREDSLDRLVDENAQQFSDEQESVESVVLHKLEVDRLHTALSLLTPEERALIQALFFEEKTERQYADELGVYRNAVHVRMLASGDRDHILSGVFNQFLSEKSEPAE